MSISNLFINDDPKYLEDWVNKNGLSNYLHRLKEENYKEIILKYKKDEVEKIKDEYNKEILSMRKIVADDFNTNKNNKALAQGLSLYGDLLEQQVLDRLSTIDTVSETSNSYDKININIEKEYGAIKDTLSKDLEIHKKINSTSYNENTLSLKKTLENINLRKKKENLETQLKSLPEKVFKEDLGRAVGNSLKEKMESMIDDSIRESGVQYTSSIERRTNSGIKSINKDGVRVSINESPDSLMLKTQISIIEPEVIKTPKQENINLFSGTRQEIGAVGKLIESVAFDSKMSNYKRAYIYNTLRYGNTPGFFQSKYYDLKEAITNSYLDIVIEKNNATPINLLNTSSIILENGKAINIYDILLNLQSSKNKIMSFIEGDNSSDEISSYRNNRLLASILS